MRRAFIAEHDRLLDVKIKFIIVQDCISMVTLKIWLKNFPSIKTLIVYLYRL